MCKMFYNEILKKGFCLAIVWNQLKNRFIQKNGCTTPLKKLTSVIFGLFSSERSNKMG